MRAENAGGQIGHRLCLLTAVMLSELPDRPSQVVVYTVHIYLLPSREMNGVLACGHKRYTAHVMYCRVIHWSIVQQPSINCVLIAKLYIVTFGSWTSHSREVNKTRMQYGEIRSPFPVDEGPAQPDGQDVDSFIDTCSNGVMEP